MVLYIVGELNVSANPYALAIDEMGDVGLETSFEPELSVIVNPRLEAHDSDPSNDIVRIRGRITVSF